MITVRDRLNVLKVLNLLAIVHHLKHLYPSLYNLTRHNTGLLNEYIKKDDFKGLVECFNVSLNKKRNKNINLVRWNQSGDIYTRFELEALKKVAYNE